MDWKESCACVIPCFNEAAGIAALVTAVQPHLPAVIVVDDGSTDQTAASARAAGADVLQFPRNRGKGTALRAGLDHARARRFAHAVTLDGDGQHSPEDIPLFFRCAETTGADLVIGNRFAAAERLPWLRRFVNRWMTARLSELCGRPLSDSQCGFRLVRLEPWARLSLRTEHFEIESEMLVEFIRAGGRVEFVPIQVICRSRGSRIRPTIDGWRWLRWWCSTGNAAD